MKPHLRRIRGLWYCGLRCEDSLWWACAAKPDHAYRLWARGRA